VDADIVVFSKSHPVYVMALFKAAGVICEYGGKLSHICIVALEIWLLCITFGYTYRLLLLSLRSSVTVFMPGMFDTIHNAGSNDQILKKNQIYLYKSYLHFVITYSQMIKNINLEDVRLVQKEYTGTIKNAN